jgi:outer membrane protein OmpA-like peptidoglycan-associated protein
MSCPSVMPVAAVAVAAALVVGACSSSGDGNPLADPSGAAPTVATTPVHPDVRLRADEVIRAGDGTLWLPFTLRNDGESALGVGDLLLYDGTGPISLYDPEGNVEYWPAPASGASDRGDCVCPRTATAVPAGGEVTLHVAYTGVPEAVEEVRVQIGRFTPLAGVPVRAGEAPSPGDGDGDGDGDTDGDGEGGDLVALAGSADESPTWSYTEPMVPTEAPGELPPVDETGPELPEVPVTETLTSDVQPGWSIDVRGVVRGPGDLSTLLLDLTTDGSTGDWPQGLGSDDYDQGLGAVSVIDPEAQVRYEMVGDEQGALSSGDSWYPGESGSLPVYAVFRALDPSTTEVTVDIPSFGRVERVPVVDGPDTASEDDAVRSTLRLRGREGLRLDVLTVSRLDGGNGTLVRTRLVNESGGEPVTAPFATEGEGGDLCNMELTDPATGDYLWTPKPCEATSWTAELAEGEQLVYEVRFPELPRGVEHVVLSGGGYLPSAPIPVTDGELPWYLTLPHPIEGTDGGTLVIPEGSPDGSETTTRTGDTVEVELSTDVLFAFDSAALTPEAARRIAALAGRIGDQAAAGTITVTGHTDDVGDDAYNQTLSEQRAESVRAALEPAIGRSDLTFEVVGRGETEPAAPNQINGTDNPDGRARNRRVTILYQAS